MGGGAARTLGYYEPGDGGSAIYKIVETSSDLTVALDNGLYAELNIDKEINVKQLGAYGDNEHDDTDIIQFAIDYAYDTGIKNVFLEAGVYKTTKPLFIYDQIAIYGKNSNSSTIHKTTNIKTNISGHDYDAILFLINRSLKPDDSSSVQNVKVHDITLTGNISTYTADKSLSDRQFAIKGLNNIPKTQISDFLIRNVDMGIYARGLWTGWIKNCTWLQSFYNAICFTAETQGLNIANINTGGTHVCGIEVHGSSYSTLSNILVEWTYGGTAFIIGNWSGDILNCGTELGSGVYRGFYFESARARLTGTYISGNTPTDEGNYMLWLNNSTVEIDNSSIGYAIREQQYKGGFAYVANHSHLKIGDGTNFLCTFRDACNGDSADDNKITYLGRTITLNTSRAIASLTERYTWFTSTKLPFIDGKFEPEGKIRNINVFQDYVNNPNKTLNAADTSWQPAYMKGDIGLIYNSKVNGKAAWICNRGNRFDAPISEGTIVTVASGVLTMSSLQLENYENTGMRFYTNATIKGQNSGATAYISSINYDTNKIGYTGLTDGPFEEGEKIYLPATNNFARDGDYLYIPIIMAGHSVNRPSASIATGTMYFDTVLGKPIWWDGSKWVDSEGTDVSNLSV